MKDFNKQPSVLTQLNVCEYSSLFPVVWPQATMFDVNKLTKEGITKGKRLMVG